MSAQTDLYDSVYNDVMTLTKRPQLDAETHVALRSATRTAHASGTYLRDIITRLVQLPNASYITSLDAQILFPRLRGLASVQLLDTSFQPMQKPEITIKEFDDIRDPIYHQVENNIAYVAGTAVNIRSYVPASGYLVGYYEMPLVQRENYNSWIAQLAPDIIIYQAAATVFGTVGEPEKVKAYTDMVEKTFKPQLIQNFTTSAMR